MAIHMAMTDLLTYEDTKMDIEHVREEVLHKNDAEAVALCDATLELIASDRNYFLIIHELGLDADDSDRLIHALMRCVEAHGQCDRATEVLRNKLTGSIN